MSRDAASPSTLRPPRALGQFIGFGAVGVVGYLVDAAVLYGVMGWTGPYAGRVVSYLAAATMTFALNRRFVFDPSARRGSLAGQWVAFLAANLIGAALNIGLSSLLVWSDQPVVSEPWAALACGALAGWVANFLAVRRLVFRESAEAAPQ